MYVYLYVYMFIYLYEYICVYIYICIYVYICMSVRQDTFVHSSTTSCCAAPRGSVWSGSVSPCAAGSAWTACTCSKPTTKTTRSRFRSRERKRPWSCRPGLFKLHVFYILSLTSSSVSKISYILNFHF